jgi:penicillin-binding protein 1C
LALGSAEVTLLDLSNAYRTLANGGRWQPPRWLPAGGAAGANAPPQRVADAAASHLVGDILADNAARAATFGLDSALALPGFAAVKTGTSKDMRDNWCIGFSDRFTVGVWVGNASGAPMHQISGVGGAAPVWRSLMLALHEGRPSQPPPLQAGVVATRLRYADAREPERTELFVAGTEQSLVWPTAQAAHGTAAAHASRRYGITHPTDGSIFALDPDIPPAAQRIVFEGEAGQWRLGGRTVAGSNRSRSVSWAPWPGKHELSLVAADGRVLQTVRFEVRGAVVKGAEQMSLGYFAHNPPRGAAATPPGGATRPVKSAAGSSRPATPPAPTAQPG